MKYLAYNPITGVLHYYYESPTPIEEAPENLWLLSGELTQDMLETHYVAYELLIARPSFAVVDVDALVDTSVIFSELPVGTVVSYPGGSVVVNDGFVEWSSDTPGNYEFKFSLWPYLDKTVYARIT